jgi:hypothetical protein
MGKLTPEEWRPFIASGLVYVKNLNIGLLSAYLPMFGVALLEPLIIIANFDIFPNSAQFAILRYLTFGLVFVLLGLGFVFSLRRMKNLFFKADQRAAQLVGKESLVSSLTKIASIDGSIRANRRGLVRPSVDERVNHLRISLTLDRV